MKKLLICLGAAVALAAGACSKSDDQQPNRFEGPAVAVGNGKANTWLTLDGQGNATAIGFTLGKGAFDNLSPTTETDFMLELPAQALQTTPFQHVMINWNPLGHPPAGIYDVPHFDMHFYMVPMSEVMSILPYAQNPAPFDNNPAAVFLPTGYVKNPGGVPAMGAHWSNMASPEFSGQPFTQTFVYGSYNGHVTFWEPMMALSYLKTNPVLDQLILQPAQYEKPGYYPTHYTLNTDAAGNQHVALSQFVKR